MFQFKFTTEQRLPNLFQVYAGVGGGVNAPANSPPPVAAGTPIIPPRITSFGSMGLGQRQSYTVTMVKGGVSTPLTNGAPLYVVPSNTGPRTMNYMDSKRSSRPNSGWRGPRSRSRRIPTILSRMSISAGPWRAVPVTGDPGYYAKAQEEATRSLALAPGNLEARKLEVWLLLGRHDFGRALAAAKALNRQARDDLMIYGFLADANAELGDYKAAEDAV